MSSSTALARQPAKTDLKGFAAFLKGHQSQIAAVATNHLDPERVTRIVFGCVSRTPKLAECSMGSIVRTVLQASELGLELGSATGHAYPVPFGSECQLVIGYRGLLDLARRTGDVASVTVNAVYAGDEFEIEYGLSEALRHKPIGDPDPTTLTGAYAIVRFKDGSHQMGYMTRRQIDAIRARSRAGNSGPWVTDYAEMARKTVLRNVLKYCPMSLEAQRGIAIDTYADTGDATILAEFEADTIEDEPAPAPVATPTATATAKLRDKVAAKAAPEPVEAPPEPVTEPEPEPEPAPKPTPRPRRAAAPEPEPEPEPEQEEEIDPEEPEEPEFPPYDPTRNGLNFQTVCVSLGLVERDDISGVTNLRRALLPELETGQTWRDITEEQYQTLVAGAVARANA